MPAPRFLRAAWMPWVKKNKDWRLWVMSTSCLPQKDMFRAPFSKCALSIFRFWVGNVFLELSRDCSAGALVRDFYFKGW